MKPRTLLVALALVGGASPARAQSLFNAAGLGLPVDALDARSRSLGSFGLGLQGAGLSSADPAAAGRLRLPTGLITAQPSWVDFSDGGSGQTGTLQGSRFPLLAFGYPGFGGVVSIQATSFLDQRFVGQRDVTVVLSDGPVAAVDHFTQTGGVSKLSVAFSRMIGERLSVGVDAGRYTGSMDRKLVRDFGVLAEGDSTSYTTTGQWSYGGYALTAGASADLGSVARLAGSVTWSTALDANASSSTAGSDRSFDLPLQLRVGASAVLAPGLVLNASAVHADWSGIADNLMGSGSAGSTTGFGVGVELPQGHLLGKRSPLRLGFRRSGLPFSFGSEHATERVFSGGLGLYLNEAVDALLAGADFSIERGRRTSGSLVESFWRATASLRVSGF